MKRLDTPEFEKHRVDLVLPDGKTFGEAGHAFGGAFEVRFQHHILLRVIASNAEGWDHLSIHAFDTGTGTKRIPTYEEMEFIAKMFFKPDEVAMQLHVPSADHINVHPMVLHWWRPHSKLKRIPLPPKRFV